MTFADPPQDPLGSTFSTQNWHQPWCTVAPRLHALGRAASAPESRSARLGRPAVSLGEHPCFAGNRPGGRNQVGDVRVKFGERLVECGVRRAEYERAR